MARRPSLAQPPRQAPAAPAPRPPDPATPKSRQGKRSVMFWIDRAAYQELQVATARMETTIQAAGEEMFADWCRKHAIKLPG